MRGASLTDLFWTDTSDASNNANAYVIDFRIDKKLRFHSVPKTDTELNEKGIGVRAFIAF